MMLIPPPMIAKVSITLTPICRNAEDPTWSEPFLQAAQWALENPHELIADARRVCHRDFCETLLESWPEKEEVPGMIGRIAQLGRIQLDVSREEGDSEGFFEDAIQILCAFGRVVCERAIKNRLLVSNELCYYVPNHGEI